MVWIDRAPAKVHRIPLGVALVLLLIVGQGARAETGQAPLEIRIGILSHKVASPPLYDVDAVPPDAALAGARLAIKDDNTTGGFTGQHFTLDEATLLEGQSPVEAAGKLVDAGAGLLLGRSAGRRGCWPWPTRSRSENVTLFNVGAADDRLRGADCRANLFHVAPSRAMLADALMQFLAVKRWTRLFLIVGPTPADQLYAAAVRHAAAKFGLKIASEKAWDFGALARARGDSVTQADALVFTRGVDYDIMVVADEAGDFGDYIPYHTWDPKQVAGTQGLIAASWHPTQDAWGSAQLQNRFLKLAKRRMGPLDYQAWTAVRAIGEAATRAKTADPRGLASLLGSGAFDLAAFKGVPVSFRPWDRQLRQPILVAQPTALVGVSPQPGFLHERTPLDTLGVDKPETACHVG